MEGIKEKEKENKRKTISKVAGTKAAKFKKIFSSQNKLSILVLPFLILALVGGAIGYYYWAQYQKMKNSPDLASQKETEILMVKVGQLMELPKDENPTVATVTDKEKVKSQPFFANAENGDKVLIFVKAQKAILYRRSMNKIINVSSVNLNQAKTGADQNSSQMQNQDQPQESSQSQLPADQGTSSDSVQETLRVALYNGSTIVGLTLKAETRINEAVDNVVVVTKQNAQNHDYENSTVVNLSGKSQDKVQAIADIFKAQVSDMPTGEAKPDADVLVILGKEN